MSRPDPGYAVKEDYLIFQMKLQESRRWQSQNLPWYIEAIGNGATLEVTGCVKRATARCLTCGFLLKIGDPKYHYENKVAHESWEVLMCETCHCALVHDVELVATCKQIKVLENYENHAKVKGIHVDLSDELTQLHELRKAQTAAGTPVQDGAPSREQIVTKNYSSVIS